MRYLHGIITSKIFLGGVKTKYFNKIAPSEGSDNKTWKSNVKLSCAFCRREIDKKNDYFELKAFWKIKNKPDMKHFCSVKCLKKWAGEENE